MIENARNWKHGTHSYTCWWDVFSHRNRNTNKLKCNAKSINVWDGIKMITICNSSIYSSNSTTLIRLLKFSLFSFQKKIQTKIEMYFNIFFLLFLLKKKIINDPQKWIFCWFSAVIHAFHSELNCLYSELSFAWKRSIFIGSYTSRICYNEAYIQVFFFFFKNWFRLFFTLKCLWMWCYFQCFYISSAFLFLSLSRDTAYSQFNCYTQQNNKMWTPLQTFASITYLCGKACECQLFSLTFVNFLSIPPVAQNDCLSNWPMKFENIQIASPTLFNLHQKWYDFFCLMKTKCVCSRI